MAQSLSKFLRTGIDHEASRQTTCDPLNWSRKAVALEAVIIAKRGRFVGCRRGEVRWAGGATPKRGRGPVMVRREKLLTRYPFGGLFNMSRWNGTSASLTSVPRSQLSRQQLGPVRPQSEQQQRSSPSRDQ